MPFLHDTQYGFYLSLHLICMYVYETYFHINHYLFFRSMLRKTTGMTWFKWKFHKNKNRTVTLLSLKNHSQGSGTVGDQG
jgi:hypothetical protein